MNELLRFLMVSSELNADGETSNDYKFICLSPNQNDNAISVLSDYLKLKQDEDVTLSRLHDWEKEFLTQFKDSETFWFGKMPSDCMSDVQCPKKHLIQLIKTAIGDAVVVYAVDVILHGYYACSSEEYLLVSQQGIFFLSMQVHD